jgi:hypothetical protein
MQARWLLSSALVFALGCGGVKFAPVSGRVTLNGEPLVNAVVSFQPVKAEGAAQAPAPESTGKTDKNGEFTLAAADGRKGAWVGKHRVAISRVETVEGDDRARRGGPPQGESIPARYNKDSKEEFDVLGGGTDQANFELKKP